MKNNCTCDRCGKETSIFKMSIFNTQELCSECKAAEELRPDFAFAREIELKYVQKKEYNFAGIGLYDYEELAKKGAFTIFCTVIEYFEKCVFPSLHHNQLSVKKNLLQFEGSDTYNAYITLEDNSKESCNTTIRKFSFENGFEKETEAFVRNVVNALTDAYLEFDNQLPFK